MFKYINKFNWLKNHFKFYPTKINLKYSNMFGFTLSMLMIIQIIVDIFLSFHYIPSISAAYSQVFYVFKQSIPYSSLLRNLHVLSSSFLFFFIYLHLFKALFLQSYILNPLAYYSSLVLYLLLCIISFLSYVLPWSQLSYWALSMMTNIVTALPAEKKMLYFLWDDLNMGNSLLSKVYTLHILLPFLLLLFIIMHINLIHSKSSSKNPKLFSNATKTINLYPNFIMKNLFMFSIFTTIFFLFLAIDKHFFSNPMNFMESNHLITPSHISPKWYFLIFYGMLKNMPNKEYSILSILFLFFILLMLPMMNSYKIKMVFMKFKNMYKLAMYMKIRMVCLIIYLFIMFMHYMGYKFFYNHMLLEIFICLLPLFLYHIY